MLIKNRIKLSKRVCIGYLLAILWMGLIYYFSSCNGDVSAMQSSEFKNLLIQTTPDMNKLIDNMMVSGLNIFSIRKLAHMFLYMVLTILLYIPTVDILKRINLSLIVSASISLIYAILDEIHQLFVPGRSGQVTDVMIDGMGSLIGILAIILTIKVLKVVSKNKEKAEKVIK